MLLAVSVILVCTSLQNGYGGWTAFRVCKFGHEVYLGIYLMC